jgi:DNA polymerase-3 subunit delta
VQKALTRLKPDVLQKILQMSAMADQQIKGQVTGDYWDSLFGICLAFTGVGSPVKSAGFGVQDFLP